MDTGKQKSKITKGKVTKGDDTMSAVARNYVYEVRVNKDKKDNEKVVSKEFLNMCRKWLASIQRDIGFLSNKIK